MDTSPVTTPATWRVRVGTGIVLGLIGTLWLVVFHGLVAIGGQSQPPFALHWLLLATIALPPTCLLSLCPAHSPGGSPVMVRSPPSVPHT